MSFDIKNKENNCKYCYECISKNDVEHVCSSQLNISMDRMCSYFQPEAYFTAPNSLNKSNL